MNFSRESLNKICLGFAFMVGIIGIVLLKSGIVILPKMQEIPVYWIIVWPIAVMITYLTIAVAMNSKNLYETLGDNCYYLGFVFTLTSLAVTLYLLYGPGDGKGDGLSQVGEVISGFGVALSSTIVGIMLRVLMLRMTPDIAQQESEARVDFDLAVRDFRTHLRMSIGELKRYSVETVQMLAEQRDAVQERLAHDADAHKQATEASAAALVRFSEEAGKKFSDHWAALQEGMQQDARAYRDAVQEGVADFRKALNDVTATLSEPEVEVRDALRQSIEDHRQALESGADSLRLVLRQAVKAFAEYRAEADRLASLSRTTFEQTRESAETARNELERMKALTENITVLSSESRGLDAVLSGLTGKLGKVEDGIAATLEPALLRIGEGATAISETLAASSGKLKSAAERFESAAERTTAADMQTNIAGAAERLSDAVERLEKANNTLAAAMEKLGELTERTGESRQPRSGWRPPWR